MNCDAPSVLKTVHGTWRRASSSANIDIEAQTITSTHGFFALPVSPEQARAAPTPVRTPHISDTNTTARSSADAVADAIDDFFGATRESRHDSCPSHGRGGKAPLPSSPPPSPPPPYADGGLPAYWEDPDGEPVTLTKYLFRYGFLFPPLWILGAIMLVSPLVPPAEFERSKSGMERERIVRAIRDAEVRWAWRCVWALGVLLVLAGVVASIVLVVCVGERTA